MNTKTFVFLSITDWDAPQFGSRQQIARRLARRGHHVLFVDVPRALHSLISDRKSTWRAISRMGRLRPIEPNLVVYTPPFVLPIYYHPVTNSVNQRLLAFYIQWALQRLQWTVDVLWTYWPNSGPLVGRLGERMSVYHCIDNFTAVQYPLTPAHSIQKMEAELCRRVNLVFARTAGLAAARQPYNPATILLPGGVDCDDFDPGTAVPDAQITTIPPPRLGFVGTMDDRLDVDLLKHCATQLPDASFILVGPIRSHLVNITPLKEQPNIHFLPPCPHTAVPGILAAFDIGLIPYCLNAYTQELSPIKLYEYLAMGKPVVATNLPYVVREQAHVCLAQSPEQFRECLQKRLENPATTQERQQWRWAAQANSWDAQVEIIEQHLAQTILIHA